MRGESAPNFVAIDFETADYGADSACAIGLVKVRGNRVVAKHAALIRPPRRSFVFTYLHGIRWGDVKAAPHFGDIWPALETHLDGADFVLAHNASFDRGVLETCCAVHGLAAPEIPYVCTVKLARAIWNIRPTRLPNVCRYLNIDLRNHHDAVADALACARIGLAALKEGYPLTSGILGRSFPRRAIA